MDLAAKNTKILEKGENLHNLVGDKESLGRKARNGKKIFCSMENVGKKMNHQGPGWEKTQYVCLTKVTNREHKESLQLRKKVPSLTNPLGTHFLDGH